MDPETTLCTMLEKAQLIINEGHVDQPLLDEAAFDLAEAVIAMNDWLVNGGFLPELWRK